MFNIPPRKGNCHFKLGNGNGGILDPANHITTPRLILKSNEPKANLIIDVAVHLKITIYGLQRIGWTINFLFLNG